MSGGLVVRFGGQSTETVSDFRELGEKGKRSVEMGTLGLPVPVGFVIKAEACRAFLADSGSIPQSVKDEVIQAIRWMEQETQRGFGDTENPLMLSVRSGGMPSMQGAVAPILNIGLNDATTEGLSAKHSDPGFAYDSYRSLIQAYATGCLDMPPDRLEQLVERARIPGASDPLDSEALKSLVHILKLKIFDATGSLFPQDLEQQLWGAVGAVFQGWHSRQAVMFRNAHGLDHTLGTSVVVQAMVFGNLSDRSATGVAFTRDPESGQERFYGEWLANSQGESVSLSMQLPQPLNQASGAFEGDVLFEEALPDCYAALVNACERLVAHYRDFLVIEFTVEDGDLWILQVQPGTRRPSAEVAIAVGLAKEGTISQAEAIRRVSTSTLEKLLHPRIDPHAERDTIAHGLAASPGAATGRVVFSSKEALEWAGRGLPVILVLEQTTPDDVHGMQKSQGILTTRGGITSHAAVVARGMSRTCIVGATDVQIDLENRRFLVGSITVKEGDVITLDGVRGSVLRGNVATIQPEASDELREFLGWLDQFSDLKVFANADTAHDCKVALNFGARGVGLCRTEHMFFEEGRIQAVREMILAADEEGRRRALNKILPMQRGDFKEIFRNTQSLPVTIRLLDPPLHEFLPRGEQEIEALVADLGMTSEEVKKRAENLHEVNPMLGHRGCRMGLTFPEIYEMQVRAILEAACELKRDEGVEVRPEIMVPLIGHVRELELIRDIVGTTARRVMDEFKGTEVEYEVGTMIELPRACLTADEIAQVADFLSFGTNDLTQTVFGVSRDDCGRFLPFYVEMGILPVDPFVSLDPAVAALVTLAVERARSKKPHMKIGICGEHAGEPASVRFCHEIALDYVSCSPFRVPIARLAAAHAQLETTLCD